MNNGRKLLLPVRWMRHADKANSWHLSETASAYPRIVLSSWKRIWKSLAAELVAKAGHVLRLFEWGATHGRVVSVRAGRRLGCACMLHAKFSM